ncbi:hypothetical protein Pint_20809 [Pistacia integerrima]|uniref:Uncharacterized protein n=1 Tax=Pistacia integerrima TaxID=434235 RepID=A0ACC0X9T0_9ROSI|nr:hypothetical protein Pint_20809 [Pistacia integerrima]
MGFALWGMKSCFLHVEFRSVAARTRDEGCYFRGGQISRFGGLGLRSILGRKPGFKLWGIKLSFLDVFFQSATARTWFRVCDFTVDRFGLGLGFVFVRLAN